MNIVNDKIVGLEDEIFFKFDEVLELMRAQQTERLKECQDSGMPSGIFEEQTSLQMARFDEIKDALKLEYYLRFHNEMHFQSPTTCAVIQSSLSEGLTEQRRKENLNSFGQNFFDETLSNVSVGNGRKFV